MNTESDLSLQKPFKIIAAVCKNNGIGKNNGIPWHNLADFRHFMQTTKTARGDTINAIIMGMNTWKSLGSKPLPGRINIIVTRDYHKALAEENSKFFPTLLSATNYLNQRMDIDNVFIIGGAQLYSQAITLNWSHELILTRIPGEYDCDVFFPEIPTYWRKTESFLLKDSDAIVETYTNHYGGHYEAQYLLQMGKLKNIPPIVGRNGSVHTDFQWSLTVDLQDGLPLFSTRRGFWRGICTELLFFIRGDTNSNHLSEQGIKIWDDNTTSEFLAKRGLDYQVGDMGPMYGWVWRHYGAKYHGMDHDYEGEGHDQLYDVIQKLIHTPNDRRIMMTAYDPSKVKDSVLAPCHSIVNHFFVREEPDRAGKSQKFLDMYTYQRSADMFLGVYFNIPSDATLQMIIAQAVGMKPGKMHLQFGNNHVYHNHLDALEKQLERIPNTQLPQLSITGAPNTCGEYNLDPAAQDVKTTLAMRWIENLQPIDFKLTEYCPQQSIKAEMVA
jgi:dihydrofolate reductase/thymidylate synthase